MARPRISLTFAVWEAFPLLMLVVIAYSALVVILGAENMATSMSSTMFNVPIISGDQLAFRIGDLFLLISILLLFIEVLKATQTDQPALLNHGLSMMVFTIALILMVTLRGFGTSTFLLITCLTLFDVVAGFVISAIAARRDIGLHRQTSFNNHAE